jgi:Holliday junction resolvase
MSDPDPLERGRLLERQVADFFRRHGYEVTNNSVLEGRSGASHEVDVMAVTSDPLMTFRVGVECKAWSAPVSKDVVAKHDMVVRDLGLNKGIVVALEGASAGALTTARELGIEIWGPDELREQLGDAAAAELGAGYTPELSAIGWERRLDAAEAQTMIDREARGLLGIVGRESVAQASLLWFPWHAMRIAIASREGRIRRKLRTRRIWNLYDAVSGRLVRSSNWEEVPPLSRVDIAAGHLPTLVKARSIQSEIHQAFSRYCEVVTDSARERYEERLSERAIPLPVEEISIEDTSVVYQPLHLAVLRRRDSERVVAIDAHGGRRAQDLEEILTGHVAVVRRALNPD